MSETVSMWALELLQSRDVAESLRASEKSKSVRLLLELLDGMQWLLFEEGMQACLERIGRLSWNKEEEARCSRAFFGLSGDWATVSRHIAGACRRSC